MASEQLDHLRRTTIVLEGEDAGVSVRAGADPVLGLCFCLIANNSPEVRPIASVLDKHLLQWTSQGRHERNDA